MKIYTLPNGSQVSAFDQFQIGDQRYPSGWLSTAPDADIAAIGITVSVGPDPAPPQPSPASLAQAALDASDMTAIRCFKAGVPFPAEWFAYTQTLRNIVKSNNGSLPARPAFPANT